MKKLLKKGGGNGMRKWEEENGPPKNVPWGPEGLIRPEFMLQCCIDRFEYAHTCAYFVEFGRHMSLQMVSLTLANPVDVYMSAFSCCSCFGILLSLSRASTLLTLVQ